MTTKEAIKALDDVIPEPTSKMVDLDHLHIALAWRQLKKVLLARDRLDNSLDAITLSKAFRLCGIREERVFLRAFGDPECCDYYFWSTRVRELLDMKKLLVTRIEPCFDPYSPDYNGMCFTVKGMTSEELRNASYRASNKGVKI